MECNTGRLVRLYHIQWFGGLTSGLSVYHSADCRLLLCSVFCFLIFKACMFLLCMLLNKVFGFKNVQFIWINCEYINATSKLLLTNYAVNSSSMSVVKLERNKSIFFFVSDQTFTWYFVSGDSLLFIFIILHVALFKV